MLQVLIISALGLLSGEVLSCESDSSPSSPHSCPLEETSRQYRQLQLSDSPRDEDQTPTSTDRQRNVQPELKLTMTSLNLTSGSTSVPHLSGQFSYDVHMALFLDGALVRAVTPDMELALKQRVWVKLEVKGVTASALGLTVHHCWATNEPSPAAAIRYGLIAEGCPQPGETNVTLISNGASLVTVFSFRAFRFVADPPRDVFLHCQAQLCILKNGCVPNCLGPERRQSHRSLTQERDQEKSGL